MKKFTILRLELLKKIFPNSVRILKVKSGPLKGYKFSFTKNINNEYILGLYEKSLELKLHKILSKGNTFYDIGAHIGYFSLVASKFVGEKGNVFSFEPFPGNFKLLTDHIQINSIKNIFAYNYAVSDKNGVVYFTNDENDMSNTYIESSPMFDTESEKIRCETITLDSLLERNEITLPDFVKIDVEGAEYDVLNGMQQILSKSKPVIHLSTHDNHNPGVAKRCLSFLSSLNFKVVEEKEHKESELMKEYLVIKSE